MKNIVAEKNIVVSQNVTELCVIITDIFLQDLFLLENTIRLYKI